MERITVGVAVEDVVAAARAAGFFKVITTTGPAHIEVRPAADGVLEFVFTPYTPEEVEERGIEELGLSVRAYNVLKRAGIHTIGQLLRQRDADLRVLAHWLPVVSEWIDEALWRWGLHRAEEKWYPAPQVVAGEDASDGNTARS